MYWRETCIGPRQCSEQFFTLGKNWEEKEVLKLPPFFSISVPISFILYKIKLILFKKILPSPKKEWKGTCRLHRLAITVFALSLIRHAGRVLCLKLFVSWKSNNEKKVENVWLKFQTMFVWHVPFFAFRVQNSTGLFISLGIHNQLSTCGLLYDLWSYYYLLCLLQSLPLGVYLCECGGWMIKIND